MLLQQDGDQGRTLGGDVGDGARGQGRQRRAGREVDDRLRGRTQQQGLRRLHGNGGRLSSHSSGGGGLNSDPETEAGLI